MKPKTKKFYLALEDIRYIIKQSNGMYVIRLKNGYALTYVQSYPDFDNVEIVKQFIRDNLDKVRFIHILPSIWWVIQLPNRQVHR